MSHTNNATEPNRQNQHCALFEQLLEVSESVEVLSYVLNNGDAEQRKQVDLPYFAQMTVVKVKEALDIASDLME